MVMMILGVTIKVTVEVETDIPAVTEAEVTQKTEMTEMGMEIEVNTKKGIMTIEVKTKKIPLAVAENNGMIMGIETIGDREGDGQGGRRGRKWDNNKGQGNGNRGRGHRWNQHPQYPP